MVLQCPTASKFSSAKPIGIHHLVAARANRICAVLLHALPQRTRLASLEFSFNGGTFGGGGVAGSQHIGQNPFAALTGEVRLG